MLKLGELGGLIKGLKSGIGEIRSRASKYNAAERDYETRPADGNEMQEKHIHAEIDQGAGEVSWKYSVSAAYWTPQRPALWFFKEPGIRIAISAN